MLKDAMQYDHKKCLDIICEFEGCSLKAYPDPRTGGEPWTIGYGTTCYSNGTPVKKGDMISKEKAELQLHHEVQSIALKLSSTIPYWTEMNENQRSALISFAYNLGAGFYGKKSFGKISKTLSQRAWGEVPAVMLLYRNPGSTVEAGLRRRREAEGRLWAGCLTDISGQEEDKKLRPKSPFSAQLTPHIRLGEFSLFEEARRFDHQHQVETALELATFLERARKEFGGNPVVITSGYRPRSINQSVGGAYQSEHLFDAPDVGACDFYIDGADINTLQTWCDNHWPFSIGYGATKGFVHCGIRKGRPRARWDDTH